MKGKYLIHVLWICPVAALIYWAVLVGPFLSTFIPNGLFEAATADYSRGKFDTSASLLKEAQQKTVSTGLLHNLGNTEFKLDHIGPAILAWERAHALDPSFRNTTANLRFARGHAGLSDAEYTWHEKYSALVSPDVWLWTATAAFWIAFALLTLPALLKRKRTAWTQGGAVVAIGVFLLTLPALAGIVARGKLGVVMVAESILRLTPTKEAEMLGKLAEGELARVEKTHGEYVYIRATSDRAGWVRSQEFEKIWP